MWSFLTGVLRLGNKALALRLANANLSPSSAYRIWKRFLRAQSNIRSTLAPLCKAPDRPHAVLPPEQTLAHLEAAFPPPCCPITAFQLKLQVSLF
jgi:hypothetical protein